MSGLAPCQLAQRGEIAAHESFFLCTAPSLELSLVFDRIRNSLEPLREHEFNRSARLCVASERACIVLGYPDLQRRSGDSDVVASVGTSQNVEPRSVQHSSARPILRDARKGALLRMRLTAIEPGSQTDLSAPNKMAPRGRHFASTEFETISCACRGCCRRGGPSAARSPWCRRERGCRGRSRPH